MFFVNALDVKYFKFIESSEEGGRQQKELCYTLNCRAPWQKQSNRLQSQQKYSGEEPPLITRSCVPLCFSVKLRTQKKENHGAPIVLTLCCSAYSVAILLKVLVQRKDFRLTS